MIDVNEARRLVEKERSVISPLKMRYERFMASHFIHKAAKQGMNYVRLHYHPKELKYAERMREELEKAGYTVNDSVGVNVLSYPTSYFFDVRW